MLALFVDIAVIIFFVIFLAMFITQIVIPCFRGTVLFPDFRRRYRRAEKEVVTLTTEEDLAELDRQVVELRTRLGLTVVPPKTNETADQNIPNGRTQA